MDKRKEMFLLTHRSASKQQDHIVKIYQNLANRGRITLAPTMRPAIDVTGRRFTLDDIWKVSSREDDGILDYAFIVNMINRVREYLVTRGHSVHILHVVRGHQHENRPGSLHHIGRAFDIRLDGGKVVGDVVLRQACQAAGYPTAKVLPYDGVVKKTASGLPFCHVEVPLPNQVGEEMLIKTAVL